MTPRLPQPGGTHEAGSEPDSPRWNRALPLTAWDTWGNLNHVSVRLVPHPAIGMIKLPPV